MLTTHTGTTEELHAVVQAQLADYRWRVFVEGLGWDLPGREQGRECDQFDRPDTLYVVVRGEDGGVCGCARLLSTEQAYLLGSVFPALMDGQPLPCAPHVWELSRYTTQLFDAGADSRARARERFGVLLKAVVEAALERGAQRLITFSFTGVERLARAFGVHVHRAGAPQLIDGRPVVAFWVELDAQTRAALGITAAPAPRTH